VEGDPLDEAGEVLAFGCGLRRRHPRHTFPLPGSPGADPSSGASTAASSPKKISTAVSAPSKSTSYWRPYAPRMLPSAMDFPPFIIHSRVPPPMR
jgi:hypothetical protein